MALNNNCRRVAASLPNQIKVVAVVEAFDEISDGKQTRSLKSITSKEANE